AIDCAGVVVEQERVGRDAGLELPRLRALLCGQEVLLREAAVMRRHGVLAEPLREMPRRTLAEPAGVDEQQRRAMRADQVSELVVDLGPDLVRHDRLERRGRQLELEVALADVPDVDDLGGPAAGADQELRNPLERLGRRGYADADRRLRRQRLEALERQREMRAPLVAGE